MCDKIEKNKKLEYLSLLSSYICGEYQSFWLKNQGRDRFWNMESVPFYKHGKRSVRPRKKFSSVWFLRFRWDLQSCMFRTTEIFSYFAHDHLEYVKLGTTTPLSWQNVGRPPKKVLENSWIWFLHKSCFDFPKIDKFKYKNIDKPRGILSKQSKVLSWPCMRKKDQQNARIFTTFHKIIISIKFVLDLELLTTTP
jgi:hypothetical protein